jgi:hypothetical protein
MAGGCADNNNLLSTASVAPDKTVVAAKVDPACVALSNQIDALRAEGSVERLEKAAAGKTSNVQVKRTSLAKQAELNKAYADFQTKCGPQIPKAQTAQAAPVAATSQVASTSTATASAGSTTQPVKAAATTAAQTAVQTAPKN